MKKSREWYQKMITTADFANVLRETHSPTPQTDEFDRSKYAQKEERWWDESTGTQKEHIICWFARKYFDNGSTKKCIESNYHIRCNECHFAKNENSPDCNPQTKNAQYVFNHMKRPEMYLWIAETLKILSEEELRQCICKLKKAMDENPNKRKSKPWKDVIKQYITWEKIEQKLP